MSDLYIYQHIFKLIYLIGNTAHQKFVWIWLSNFWSYYFGKLMSTFTISLLEWNWQFLNEIFLTLCPLQFYSVSIKSVSICKRVRGHKRSVRGDINVALKVVKLLRHECLVWPEWETSARHSLSDAEVTMRYTRQLLRARVDLESFRGWTETLAVLCVFFMAFIYRLRPWATTAVLYPSTL